MPKLSINLVSIHKLTKDFNCIVAFSSTHCEFQDQGMGKMIRPAREKNGPYHLEVSDEQNSTSNNFPFSFFYESSLSNKNKLWLHHLCLGHPLFSVLKIIFPYLFKGIDMGIFHCDVYELAKHKRTSFLINNKRMSSLLLLFK